MATTAMVVANLLLLPVWVLGKGVSVLTVRATLFWLAFFVLGFASALFAVDSNSAFEQLRLYFSVFLLGLGFSVWLGKPSRRMVTGFLMAFCLAHILILIAVVGSASGLVSGLSYQGASVPYHSNIRHVAHHGMVAACAGLALFFMGGRFRLAGYFLGATSIFGLVFLGQRGGLLGLGVFTFAAAFFLPNCRTKIIITALMTVLLSVGLAYSLDKFGIKNRFSGSIVERVETQGSEVFTSSSGRLAVWKSSIDLAFEHPLLGNGPDGFRTSKIGRSYFGISQSHNSILQVLVEFGLPGLMLVCLYIYHMVKLPFEALIHNKRKGGNELTSVLLFSILMGFMTMSLVEGLFYHSISLIIFSILAPLAFAANNHQHFNGV